MGDNYYNYSIIVHGGAWAIPDPLRAGCLAGCERAAEAGAAVLRTGGSAVDSVVAAVQLLEDDPHFGAGFGSSLNAAGVVENDAMIMDGSCFGLGAVAAVRRVRNPISLARAVMERTPHSFLVGEGAQAFARSLPPGVVTLRASEDEMVAPFARQEYAAFSREAAQGRSPAMASYLGNPTARGHDTVGCVAVDRHGRIAVGTSTGGLPFKLPGRVGDSPLVGSGGYADVHSGVSTTGHGESIMRVMLAREVASLVEAGLAPGDACRRGVDTMTRKVNGAGGAICVDKAGRVGFAFSTPRMAYAFIEHGKQVVVGIDPVSSAKL